MPQQTSAPKSKSVSGWLLAPLVGVVSCTQVPTIIIDVLNAPTMDPTRTQFLDTNIWTLNVDRTMDQQEDATSLLPFVIKNNPKDPYNYGLLLPKNETQKYLIGVAAFSGTAEDQRCLLTTTYDETGPFSNGTSNDHISLVFRDPVLTQGSPVLCYSATTQAPTPIISGLRVVLKHIPDSTTVTTTLIVLGWNFHPKSGSTLTLTPELRLASDLQTATKGTTVVSPSEIDIAVDNNLIKPYLTSNGMVTVDVANPNSAQHAVYSTALSLP
jgi:hypothetical protein